MTLTAALQITILGLLLGGVYALMASGLTLLFGVMRVVNLAHAAFIVLGAFFGFYMWDGLGIDPLVSTVLALPVFFVFGVILYRLLFPRIEGSPRFTEMTVLMTFGLAFMAEGLMSYFFTGIFRSANPPYARDAVILGDIFIPTGQLYSATASAVLLIGLWVFLKFTRIGYGVRATMQNRDAAQIVGVDVRRVSTISFGIGMALAGAAGSLVSFLFPFFPSRHWQWIAILLSLIVLGGMGSLKGAVIGALGLAVMAAFVSDVIGPVWAPITFFGALFVVLLVRPQGLFGKKVRA
ncbi:MAG TPA: branched-chain amino acid ABC transporter permease [Acidimicrobiia bacterium]|nr:branched-chain amino acid ABC transporter permease [Acidimicrobiia bacterium]